MNVNPLVGILFIVVLISTVLFLIIAFYQIVKFSIQKILARKNSHNHKLTPSLIATIVTLAVIAIYLLSLRGPG
ncbi:hypothetical protein KDA00_00555 [Candidatus Saccharibacteria bacterium]|nr:hypothetical protein [Candidatus Saccharibacteria bacterium]